jgi:predicted CXXCH cytochrome family protein
VAGLEGDPHRDLAATGGAACEKCHRAIFAEGYMHPVEVVPRRASIPAGFPLSREGRLTCTTCHDLDGQAGSAKGGGNRYLRGGEAGKTFCDRCHLDVLALDSHRTALGEAHLQSEHMATTAGGFDPVSKNCLFCHDGVYGSMVSLDSGSFGHGGVAFGLKSGSHPIGMDYEAARLAGGRKSKLRPLALVDRRVLFFDGLVGCGSCHNPYSGLPSHLVMVDARSRLCFACHMLDS